MKFIEDVGADLDRWAVYKLLTFVFVVMFFCIALLTLGWIWRGLAAAFRKLKFGHPSPSPVQLQ